MILSHLFWHNENEESCFGHQRVSSVWALFNVHHNMFDMLLCCVFLEQRGPR